MRLKHRWTPPAGTLTTKQIWRDELVFPVAFGRTEPAGDKQEGRTHFGLWFVHRQTGQDRFIEAPFFLERSYRGHPLDWQRKWVHRGQYNGSMILALSRRMSYDIGYHLFVYDGKQWKQTTRPERNIRSLTVGQDHDFRVWDEPGPLGYDFVLSGGELLTDTDPKRFAVDYTHAFSYDSGPETPRSPEYLLMCEQLEQKPPTPSSFQSCDTDTTTQVLQLIPDEFVHQVQERPWENPMERLNDDIWLTVSAKDKDGFVQLIQLAE